MSRSALPPRLVHLLGIGMTATAMFAAGCQHSGPQDPGPPPAAARPVIRAEEELAAQREERIAAGEVVPAPSPLLHTQQAASAPRRLPPPLQPTPGAIEPEVLLVNNQLVTLPEILYPLRGRLAENRQNQTAEGFRESLQWLVRARTQQEVGTILIHGKAMQGLEEQQREMVAKAVETELQKRISREFGDSKARFESHLAAYGLSYQQYREMLERDLVARQYMREQMMPQLTVRRDELLAHYRVSLGQLSTEETRTLGMIEAPFEAFLSPGVSWAAANADARAQARLAAARLAREAHAALAERPFEEVAREYSRGVHAAQGGLWGEIGRPLQPPYDGPSKLVFQFAEGQHSEPLETPAGWCIVKCVKITPAERPSFEQVQGKLRESLLEQKFERLSAEYMIRMAEHATVSGLDAFLRRAVARVVEGNWGPAESGAP